MPEAYSARKRPASSADGAGVNAAHGLLSPNRHVAANGHERELSGRRILLRGTCQLVAGGGQVVRWPLPGGENEQSTQSLLNVA